MWMSSMYIMDVKEGDCATFALCNACMSSTVTNIHSITVGLYTLTMFILSCCVNRFPKAGTLIIIKL